MVEIHNNIKEESAQLFYSENKLECKTVGFLLSAPDITSIGPIENSTAWFDVRAQIHRDYNNGIKGTYYVQYKGSLFEIAKRGNIYNDTNATEYPFGYFDKVLNYLLDLDDFPTVELK